MLHLLFQWIPCSLPINQVQLHRSPRQLQGTKSTHAADVRRIAKLPLQLIALNVPCVGVQACASGALKATTLELGTGATWVPAKEV
jgi:hypothetical protein